MFGVNDRNLIVPCGPSKVGAWIISRKGNYIDPLFE
jgi:hypothetical protein